MAHRGESVPGRPPPRDFLIPLLAGILTYVLWDSALLFPLKVFTVFLHEAFRN